MTREQQINLIREKCIEANPEIMALEFGFQFQSKNSGNIYTVGESSIPGDTVKHLYDFLGRPIRLADVLLAIG